MLQNVSCINEVLIYKICNISYTTEFTCPQKSRFQKSKNAKYPQYLNQKNTTFSANNSTYELKSSEMNKKKQMITHQFVKHSQEYQLLEIQHQHEISRNTNIAIAKAMHQWTRHTKSCAHTTKLELEICINRTAIYTYGYNLRNDGMCEQFAHDHYQVMWWPAVEPTSR